MSKNSTWGGRTGGGVALLVLAGCAWGTDPDPREIAASRPAAKSAPARDDAPVLVVSTIAAGDPSSAPLSETMARQQTVARRHLLVPIGQNAAHVIEAPVQQAFLGDCTDLASMFPGLTDRDVVETLMLGQADFGVIGGQLSVREQHAGLRQTQIGVELFAVAVAPGSPVRSLSPSQVRQIFTGQVNDWQQLGMAAGPIVPVAPADHDLAERAARAMIPGDDFAAGVVRVASERHVADQTLQHKGAIGIVRLCDQPMETDLKLVHIDWIPPSAESFAYGTYTFGLPVQLVTSGQPTGEALRFLEFARSEAGRTLLGKKLRTQ